MGVLNIVIFVFIVLVIIYALVNVFSKTSKLTSMATAKVEQNIKASDLKNSKNSSNYTYSMWLYIDDWNYRFGDPKIVLNRGNNPRVVLGDKPNTLQVKVKYLASGSADGGVVPFSPDISNHAANLKNKESCEACNKGFTCACSGCDKLLYQKTEATTGAYDVQSATTLQALSTATDTANTAMNSSETNVHTCEIDNIPIQKWVNIIASLYNRTLDVYLDGKLVRTCVLPGVPATNNNANVLVTPEGGFSGWTSTFKYWSDASNPQEAYNIYKDGFGGSILANAINKYKLRLSMMKGQTEVGGFEI